MNAKTDNMKKELSSTQNQLTTDSTGSKTIDFPAISDNGIAIGKVSYKENGLAVKNTNIVKGVIYLIETHGTEYNDIALWAFKECLKRNDVTCQELIDSYWKAYSDPYVGKEGIQWRHLWKHIEKARHGSGQKLYTYEEMLRIVDKEKITTKHFEFIEKDKWRRK